MAEKIEDKKVNVKEDGTPIKPGEEGYLYAGKYKTVEEFEKGYGEADRKITELGQGRAESEKARKTLQGIISDSSKKDVSAEQAKVTEARQAQVKELKEAWGKGPEAAYDIIEKIADDRISSGGLLKKEEFEKGVDGDRDLVTAYNKVRGSGDRRKEFDMLKLDMKTIWHALPKEARTPGMIENVFFIAKGKANPEEIKTRILEDLKAGTSQKGGTSSDADSRTKDDKTIDGILEANEKKKIF